MQKFAEQMVNSQVMASSASLGMCVTADPLPHDHAVTQPTAQYLFLLLLHSLGERASTFCNFWLSIKLVLDDHGSAQDFVNDPPLHI